MAFRVLAIAGIVLLCTQNAVGFALPAWNPPNWRGTPAPPPATPATPIQTGTPKTQAPQVTTPAAPATTGSGDVVCTTTTSCGPKGNNCTPTSTCTTVGQTGDASTGKGSGGDLTHASSNALSTANLDSDKLYAPVNRHKQPAGSGSNGGTGQTSGGSTPVSTGTSTSGGITDGITEDSVDLGNTGPQPSEGGGTPSGNFVQNTCGPGSGGIKIQWDGLAVSWSGNGKSGTTTGCSDFSGFQGQIAVGGTGGSIVEVNTALGFDVSYVLGYNVPIVCYGTDTTKISGCNKDLYGNGGKPDQTWKNPTGPGGSHDPGTYNKCADCTPWCYACSAPDPFVAPCSGSAYTFPYDDAAFGGNQAAITCCVGPGCPDTGRQGTATNGHPEPSASSPCATCAGSGSNKRALEALQEVFFPEYPPRPSTSWQLESPTQRADAGLKPVQTESPQGLEEMMANPHVRPARRVDQGNPFSPVLPADSEQ